MRKFEKISLEQFTKDCPKGDYDDILLPVRKTMKSAGYDFISFMDITIKPNEIVKIPTGIKISLEDGEFLGIFVRSSMGFKYNVRMCNQVGIIDGDYYNNPDNEGHMWIKFYNPTDEDYTIAIGDKIAQGIFTKFLTCGDNPEEERNGGLGSTGK